MTPPQEAPGPQGQTDHANKATGGPSGAKRRIISFNCKGCQRRYHVPGQLGGRTVRCKRCDTFTVIPMVSDPPAQPQDQTEAV